MISQVRQLLNLITDAVDKLESACKSTGTSIPDLQSPFTPQSEAFRASRDAAESADIICSVASQLEAILSPPHNLLTHAITGHLRSAAIRICLESNVTEILREAGPEGLHVNDIAAQNGQDPRKLARFLRYLAINHIYREITPDVFTNTRISSMMDTLNPSQAIISHPESKYEGSSLGLPAYFSMVLDETFKASAYAWETVSDPATAKSGDPAASPLARAYNIKGTYWDLLARDESRSRRFNIGMEGLQAVRPPNGMLEAYEWNTLPAGSVIVDVGGGIGHDSLLLAQECPSLDIIVQDLPPVIEQAKKNNLLNTKVQFEVHSFFTPQPKGRIVSVFLLKHILHDWSDEYCVKILTQLRATAQKDTKLLVIDPIISYACHDPNDGDDALDIPGYAHSEAPAPLLANFGAADGINYSADMFMFVLFNSQERTIRHFNELLLSTGWKIRKVRCQVEHSFFQTMEATPTDFFES